jgi:hypothetical protein
VSAQQTELNALRGAQDAATTPQSMTGSQKTQEDNNTVMLLASRLGKAQESKSLVTRVTNFSKQQRTFYYVPISEMLT